MAKKKKKKAKATPAQPKPEVTADTAEAIAETDEAAPEVVASDNDMIVKRVTQAYEEIKEKREKYKKTGPAIVFITGGVCLSLMFTLNNKITFLILWVVTVIYICALMIRAEYKYHQFRTYLGLAEEDNGEEEQSETQHDVSDQEADAQENAAQPDDPDHEADTEENTAQPDVSDQEADAQENTAQPDDPEQTDQEAEQEEEV